MTRTDKRKQSVYIPEAMRLDGASRMQCFIRRHLSQNSVTS